jgi:glycosyltransferase involved in cell wall biosynthesis
MAMVPDVDAVIIGEGPLREHLQKVARECRVEGRLRIHGNMSQAELLNFYAAANLSVLTSRNEGMANVILESLACGTPVVATVCEGVPELLTDPAAGMIVFDRTPAAVAGAIKALLAGRPSSQATRRYAETLGWEPTAHALRQVISDSLAGAGRTPAIA